MDQVIPSNSLSLAPQQNPIVENKDTANGINDGDSMTFDNGNNVNSYNHDDDRNNINKGIDGKQLSSVLEEMNKIERIILPLPETKEQLEDLIYRYRYISQYRDHNKLEVEAIEQVFAQISDKQDKFKEGLLNLRNNAVTGVQWDENLLKEQLISLQLLSKDVNIPDNFLHEYNASSNENDSSSKHIQLERIKLSIDLYESSKLLGLPDALTTLGIKRGNNTALGDWESEKIISSLIASRIKFLENLPANLGTYSLNDALDFITKDDIPTSVDDFKMRALVELKSLKLLTKQKSLRKKLIESVASKSHNIVPSLRDSPYTLAAQRSINVRPKTIVPQTARLAEELERQELVENRRRERNLRLQRINNTVNGINERLENETTHRDRCYQMGKSIGNLHGHLEKDEQRRMERTAKQRLAALKSNDEEAYLKLLDQTKDTRITHLLKQTNSFLDSLAQAVRVQQNEVRIKRGEEIPPMTDEEREKIDYYEVSHRIKEQIDKQPSILVGGTLKEYQIKGLEWMVSLYNNHLNGILADEMGLGKTIQSISLISYLYEVKNERQPFLVIVPLSTITNWTIEFEKWAPSLRTIVYKGNPNQRKALQHPIKMGNFDVLLTTYEYIIKDRPLLAKHDWAHMIIDEGHRMKNAQSKLSYTLTHYYKSKNRLILTGTPLQNNLPELWALLNFVLPKIFNSSKTFDEWFNTPFANTGTQEKLEMTEEETLLVIRRLHKVLRPFLLRRLKKEVEKDLPDKVEKVVKCKLSSLQQQLYQQMLKHNAFFIGAGSEGATKGGIKGLNNKVMQLRKICNHPFVFDEVENVINPSRANSSLLYRVSGKFELLDRVLPKFKASGHRVLIFFQMTQVMDIMEDFLRMRDLKYMRLDGGTKAEDRTGMLKLFNAPDSEYFCFLLSTRAGGLGLNLQTADTVIIFDTDWNPHQDLQAQDRAHRIGQKNEVRILRLITTDSVEEVILERAMQKLDIDGKVIQAGKFDNKSTAEEQEEFLRRLLEGETNKDTELAGELDDEELNDILARNDNERILFKKMDEQRVAAEEEEAMEMGLKKPLPRLITKEELPPIFREDITDHLQTEPVAVGRIRERKRVYYDDGLTEEQWLQAVDNDEDLDEAIERQRLARERRQRKMLGLDSQDNSVEPNEHDSVQNTEETAVPPRETGRTRSRRNVTTPAATPEEVPDVKEVKKEEEPPKKKIKLKLNMKKEEPAKVAKAEPIKPKIDSLLSNLRELVDPSDEHSRTFIFEKLPSKKDYPDYYKVIETPVALETITKKLNKKQYKSLEDVKHDFDTMFKNAKFYNEEGSWVYVDAEFLENFVNDWFGNIN